MSQQGGRLPYPGLRSFTREETDLFFGREGSVDAMVDRLAATRFLAVLGASGSGKSSLVRTGLLDALELGLLHSAGSRWLIADFRPGDAPIANMAEGLLRAAAPDPAQPPEEDEIKLLRAFLARGPRSVMEWCAADNLPEDANLLLLVDQFEELFRYSQYAEREEAEAFVGLLLESARVPLAEARIYVAITMRSEFLGAAALIDGLAEAINRGLYLTPRMGRDQVREAIVGPAAVCGFTIEPALANRLLNDLTSFAPWEEQDKGNQLERLVRRADQLPLMQHVLNRLWSLSAARGEAGPVVLRLEDYNAVGGLRGALDAHGREILDELLPEHKEVASSIFRALTAGSSLAEAVRRPTEFGELVAIAGGDEIGVREVVEAFRAPGRNFLVPPRPAPLRSTTVVDISHESLIRQWDQFGAWLQQEIASAAAWRRLVDAAERYERGEANLLSGLALASLATWWDGEQPTAAWAKRYGGDFDRASAFLLQSREAEDAGKDAEAQERRLKTRNRLITLAAVVILCIVAPLTVFAGYSAVRANNAAATAELERQAAETERQSADVARQQALAAAGAAEAEREIAEAERLRADEERQRALTAQQDALRQAEAAELERKRADEERQRALAAQQDALRQAEAAELERKRADEEREGALVARQQAETERQRAVDSAARAEAERKRADEERERALAAQQDAMQQAAAAAEAQKQAEIERQRAVELAAEAQAERLRAEEQKRIADTERANRRLELIANRAAVLQQSGDWDASANLLGSLWQSLIETGASLRTEWLIEPIRASFARQSLAEYSVLPDFLSYAGFEGWNGTTGRFRVYSLTAKPAEDGTPAPAHKRIAVFDAMTGAVTGGFDLPPGKDLGSELDLLTPDGKRAAIVTDSGEIALWAHDQAAPALIPVPPGEGEEVDVTQLAPVATDARFALYLTRATDPASPYQIIVVDPVAQAITFTITAGELALALGVESINSLQLLGLSGDQLVLLVNDPDGRVATVGIATKIVRDLDVGGTVKSAQLTPDGQVLLSLTCQGSCTEQHLVASDLRSSAALWVEEVPLGMTFVERAARLVDAAGTPSYEAAVENQGEAIVFSFGGADLAPRRSEGAPQARMGEVAYDGAGSYRTLVAASSESSGGAIAPVGSFASYRIPEARQKLRLYVAPNSIAFHQDGETARIAGVDYDGRLLVYRRAENGVFEEDPTFRQVMIGASACLTAMAFADDGNSLLIRHLDGSLQYLSAVGTGAGVGWRLPAAAGAQEAELPLVETSPATACDAPAADAAAERLVAVDVPGRTFALLDKEGSVWWVEVSESAAASEVQPGRSAAPATREFAPLRRAADGMRWLAGDPRNRRVAAVALPEQAAGASEQQGAAIPDPKDVDPLAGRRDALVLLDPRFGAADPGVRELGGGARLPQRGEPQAAVFTEDGSLAVAYADGQLAILSLKGDTWSVKQETPIPAMAVSGLLASSSRIAVVDDSDLVIAVDTATGELGMHGRLPANPSLMALGEDGRMLSIEYDTDSVSAVALQPLPARDGITDMARLLAMRSRMDAIEDSSIEALALERAMESDPAQEPAAEIGCAEQAAVYLSGLEAGILSGESTPGQAPDCRTDEGSGAGLVELAELLATRVEDSSVSALVRDASLSAVLQMAAEGDESANRVLGAVLARIAADRGQGTPEAVALDTLRFGTGFSPAMLRAVAAGAPIEPAFLDAARARLGFDPMAHQLLAHWREREINDLDALSEALFAFAVAERLYRQGARAAEAEFAARRRAHLARILPDATVLQLWTRLQHWRPQIEDEHGGAVAQLPADAAARSAQNTRNVERLAQSIPNSLLLEAARTEFARAEILASADSDSETAVSRLLEIGAEAGAGNGWSPDLVGEYLDLAAQLQDRDPESSLRLAAAALRSIDAQFRAPIHADADAVELFRRAADMFAGTAEVAPRDLVEREAATLELALVNYRYDLLPNLDAQAENTAAEAVLESATRIFRALSSTATDAGPWNRRQAEMLFWQGVIANNRDWTLATDLLTGSRDLLRPLLDRQPNEGDIRFRYAEVLRWMALSRESSLETAEIERESIRHYSELWRNRASLDADRLAAVGIGYGFSLANLPQTLRDINVADLQDGRSAEDHVPWIAEVLALAAEKDVLNAQMVEAGAAAGDSEFVSGWYRMSSYGWALGFLAGLVALEEGTEGVTQCDVLAADPFDAGRRAPGLTLDQVDIVAAEAACSSAHAADSEDLQATYQLARVMSADASRSAEFLPLATEAAEGGVAAASTLIGATLDEKKDDRSGQAYGAAAQQVVIESFPVLYPYLSEHADGADALKGLDWYVQKAAALGVPEAHMALAAGGADDATKQVHLRLAARLWEEAGDGVAAEDARRQANALPVAPERADEVAARVAEWTPETPVDVPADVAGSI